MHMAQEVLRYTLQVTEIILVAGAAWALISHG